MINFIKSRSVRTESNFIEPDLKFGKTYLDVIKDEILTLIRIPF